MGADDKVGFGVFVDEAGGGLEPLPGSVFCLEAVGYEAGGSCFEDC